jgi:thiamine biosynthesis protein ThiS
MSKFELKFPLLCLITDPERPNLQASVEQALSAGVTMVQLRGHHLTTAQLYELAQVLRSRCQDHKAAFLVNDRLDIGLASGADGFQLGVHSFPLAVARETVGESYLLGASVHTVGEAQAAVANGADFLLVGTIFTPHSHPGVAGCGPGLLSAIKQELPACPLLAVGGITSANARQVMAAGADGIAVISAIFDAANIPQTVHELRSVLSTHSY